MSHSLESLDKQQQSRSITKRSRSLGLTEYNVRTERRVRLMVETLGKHLYADSLPSRHETYQHLLYPTFRGQRIRRSIYILQELTVLNV